MKNVTITELEQIGNNWYQRHGKLKAIYQDNAETIERRGKALRLATIMAKRVITVGLMISKYRIRSSQTSKPFPKGGIILGQRT
jgi:hypothetical protein